MEENARYGGGVELSDKKVSCFLQIHNIGNMLMLFLAVYNLLLLSQLMGLISSNPAVQSIRSRP